MSHSAEQEEWAVLGTILNDGSAFDEVFPYLTERDFYDERNRLVFKAMVELSIEGAPLDPISVRNKLKQRKCLTRAGGSSRISQMMDNSGVASNIRHYAKLIKEQSASRDLVRIGRQLQDESLSVSQRIESSLANLNEITEGTVQSSEVSIGSAVDSVLSTVLSGEASCGGIQTGFSDLDKYLLGLGASDLILMGARPSIGKSAFSLQVAANIAKRNHPVLYVSPEMSEAQLARRLLSSESGVEYERLVKPTDLDKAELLELEHAKNRIVTMPLIIDDLAGQTVDEVRVKARRMHSKGGLDLLIVDYLQLLCPGDDSKEAVTVVSRGLKAIAKDLNIPVWAVTQLSRNLEYRDSARPKLSDIRASGQLEQDADVIMFLWKPKKDDPFVIECFIEKHRNGPLGSATFHFDKDTTSFRSLEKWYGRNN